MNQLERRGGVVQSTPVKYAGFWLRLCAHIIDNLILSIAFYIIALLLIAVVGGAPVAFEPSSGDTTVMTQMDLPDNQVGNPTNNQANQMNQSVSNPQDLQNDRQINTQMASQTLRMPFQVLFFIISIALPWLYFTLFESSIYRATPGKKLLFLRVVDHEGHRISFGRANARYWAKIISFIILYIGFLMIAWTRYKQGLHDKIAHTFVLRT